jgi:phosphatidylserine/phosphatidylglycerophosphate/cardiolipin synthase-like enzyme
VRCSNASIVRIGDSKGLGTALSRLLWIRYRYAMNPHDVHFGGPDRPPGCLRDLLAAHVDAVPSGGAIDWVTYYFRDRRLAEGLLRARDRGVRVRVTLEGWPHSANANDRVIDYLKKALGSDLRVVRTIHDRWFWDKRLRPRLHEKLYIFSGPEPTAFIGSFNPSSDEPELEPDIIREIGDQDRGHNLLVALRDPELVASLTAHARALHVKRHAWIERFLPSSSRVLQGAGASLHFLPRWRSHPLDELLKNCGAGNRVRIAASHLSGTTSLRVLKALAGRGAAIEIISGATTRRAPLKIEAELRAAGVAFERLVHPEGFPMHAKFALIDGLGEHTVIFGSFNWSQSSRHTNREIAAITTEREIFDAFAERWDEIRRSSPAQVPGSGAPISARS